MTWRRATRRAVTGATIKSQTGNLLDLGLTGLGQHDVSILLLPHVTGVALSANSGASATDFITNVAAQTITGTLSGPLGAGEVVQISLDNGVTWKNATAAAGATTFSLANATLLTGSHTLEARVESPSGAFSALLSQAYMLDQTKPVAPAALRVDATTELWRVEHGRHHQRHHAADRRDRRGGLDGDAV